MLTTVGPCLSASSVKSGSSRPCASSAEGSPKSSRINSTLGIKMVLGIELAATTQTPANGNRTDSTEILPVLLAVFHRVREVFYALCRRFADHRNPVAAHRAHVHVDRAL